MNLDSNPGHASTGLDRYRNCRVDSGGASRTANPWRLHGFSEILYAFTSASNNNGSAFAGLVPPNTPFYNVALGLAIWFRPLLGQFVAVVGGGGAPWQAEEACCQSLPEPCPPWSDVCRAFDWNYPAW